MGPYQVLQRVRKVAYNFKLLSELVFVDLVFHVYILNKSIGDPVPILSIYGFGVD